ncbi:MAG: hypothetical protein CMJ58_07265 [Planctomycetaceae bacterium]|nr:hypothetical protein [Planctomycetaceae bacterium]
MEPPSDLAARLLAWRQLLRLGNVFTAVSNIAAGFLLVHRDWAPAGELVWLGLAAALLYAAGMALNDAFDADVDAQERPERPIPSGRITRQAAFAGGWLLMAGGVIAAVGAATSSARIAPVVVGGCLALMIVMYDGGLKHTSAGPWAMGWCRLLCVLLGASGAANLAAELAAWKYAAAVGAYTVGLSYLARDEAATDAAAAARRPFVLAAACWLAAVVAMLSIVNDYALAVPRWAWGTLLSVTFAAVAAGWDYAHNGRRERITVIVSLLRGFIVLDALAAAAAAGWGAAVVVLTLLVPCVVAARRAPMT